MRRMLLGTVVGGVVLFAWGVLFWAVLPFTSMATQLAPNEAAVAQALKDNLVASGVYYIPMEGAQEMSAAWVEKYKAGPIAQIFFRREGGDPNDPMYYVRGFGYLLLLALLMAVVLKQAVGQLGSYMARVWFILFTGLFATAVAFSEAVWWEQSLSYHLLYAIFNITSWFFAGLAMAAVVKE